MIGVSYVNWQGKQFENVKNLNFAFLFVRVALLSDNNNNKYFYNSNNDNRSHSSSNINVSAGGGLGQVNNDAVPSRRISSGNFPQIQATAIPQQQQQQQPRSAGSQTATTDRCRGDILCGILNLFSFWRRALSVSVNDNRFLLQKVH